MLTNYNHLVRRKIVLYPNGNKSKDVREHISLYLALDDTSSLHHGWEIYVNFRFFLHDQNNDNYLVVQGIYFFVFLPFL